MKARAIALVLAFVIFVYLLLLGQLSYELIKTSEPVAIALGAAILAFPIIGGWVVWRELEFGFSLQRLAGQEPIARHPMDFDEAVAAVGEDNADWRRWYQLGLAYDQAGDRKRARSAMRQAIDLHATSAAKPPAA